MMRLGCRPGHPNRGEQWPVRRRYVRRVGFMRDLGGWHLITLLVILVIMGLIVWAIIAIVRAASKPRTPVAGYAPVPSPRASSVADELAKLASLRASGAITEEEYQAAKAKLLGS